MKLNIGQKIAAYYFAIIAIGTLSLLCDSQEKILNQKQKTNPVSLEQHVSIDYSIECGRDATQTLAEKQKFKENYCLYSIDKPEEDK